MDKEFIYNILAVKYMKIFNVKDEMFIFPLDTFFGDIDAKIEILVDAINNNIKVSETDKFQEYLEGVYTNKKNDLLK